MRRIVSLKLILAALAVSWISGCAPMAESIDHVREDFSPLTIDFKKYSDSGFLFSTYPYQGKFKSMGIVMLTAFPEATFLDKRQGKGENEASITDYNWSIRVTKGKYMFDTLFARSRAIGADALVDVQIKNQTREYNQMYGLYLPLPGVEIIGIAIKRID